MSQDRASRLAYAREMVDKLRDAIRSGSNVVSVSTDGTSITYNRGQALQELNYWEKKVIRLSRSKSRTTSIDVSNSHD